MMGQQVEAAEAEEQHSQIESVWYDSGRLRGLCSASASLRCVTQRATISAALTTAMPTMAPITGVVNPDKVEAGEEEGDGVGTDELVHSAWNSAELFRPRGRK